MLLKCSLELQHELNPIETWFGFYFQNIAVGQRVFVVVFWFCSFKYLWKVWGKDFIKKEIVQYSTEMSSYVVLWCSCSTKSCKFLCFCGYSKTCMMTLRRIIRFRCSSPLTLQILQQELPLISLFLEQGIDWPAMTALTVVGAVSWNPLAGVTQTSRAAEPSVPSSLEMGEAGPGFRGMLPKPRL